MHSLSPWADKNELDNKCPKLVSTYDRLSFCDPHFGSLYHLELRGGRVQACQLGKLDFEIWVEGQGQDTSRQFGGGFGCMHAILPM